MRDVIEVDVLVALRDDLPEHNLSQGAIGRIFQVFTADEFEAEFFNEFPRDIKVRLRREQVEFFHAEIMVDEATFWKLIEETKAQSGGDIEQQMHLISERLAAMPIGDILAFGDIFDKFHGMAYRRELWAAAYIIGGGCSDDGFTDFRAWLIAQGEDIFYEALRDADMLVDVAPLISTEFGERGDAEYEPMNYVDRFAYEAKFGEEMPLFPRIYSYPDLSGEDWDDETGERWYPKLVAKFEGG